MDSVTSLLSQIRKTTYFLLETYNSKFGICVPILHVNLVFGLVDQFYNFFLIIAFIVPQRILAPMKLKSFLYQLYMLNMIFGLVDQFYIKFLTIVYIGRQGLPVDIKVESENLEHLIRAKLV